MTRAIGRCPAKKQGGQPPRFGLFSPRFAMNARPANLPPIIGAIIIIGPRPGHGDLA